MLNIHLVNDEKFINNFILKFNKFHGENTYYFIDALSNKPLKHIEIHRRENIKCISFRNKDVVEEIVKCLDPNVQINVFIHFLDVKKARIVQELQQKFIFRTYWIFYGADLYKRLYKFSNYELYDKNKNFLSIKSIHRRKLRNIFFGLKNFYEEYTIKTIIKRLDYFCFWNPYDFDLLIRHYYTNAKFKPFIYGSFGIGNTESDKELNSKLVVLVNHSASLSGNHITILSRLIELELNKNIQVIIPLNYGNKQVIYEVDSFARQNFNEQYVQMLEFLDNEEYYDILKKVDVAFFGHRRQEAGGNIINLLAQGAKIFLREDNSLLKFFKGLGLEIFSYEKDLITKGDVRPLSLVDKEKNKEIILHKFSDEAVDEMFKNLL